MKSYEQTVQIVRGLAVFQRGLRPYTWHISDILPRIGSLGGFCSLHTRTRASMLKCPAMPVRYRLSSSEIPSSSRIRWGDRTCLYSRFSRTMVTSSLCQGYAPIHRTHSWCTLFPGVESVTRTSYGLSTIRRLRILRDDFMIASIGEEGRRETEKGKRFWNSCWPECELRDQPAVYVVNGPPAAICHQFKRCPPDHDIIVPCNRGWVSNYVFVNRHLQ